MAEVRAVYGGPFEATLRWDDLGELQSGTPSAFWQARPSGYEPLTRVTGEVILGDTQFIDERPSLPGYSDLDCPDWFQTPVTVEWATEDGALGGTAQGNLRLGGGPTTLIASLDLADAVGALDLHLDPNLQYRGIVEVYLGFYPEGKRGGISLSATDLQSLDIYYPLGAQFPDDGCGATGFPAPADATLAWLEGQTATQAVAAWNTVLERTPIEGRRHDCAPGTVQDIPVDLSFELGAPGFEICHQTPWSAGRVPGAVSFSTATRLRSSDERLDVPLVSGYLSADSLSLRSDQSLRLPVRSADGAGLIPVEQFAALSGIHGVHPGNTTGLGYYVDAYFSRTAAGIVPVGTLLVQGIDCVSEDYCFVSDHSDVRWPADESTNFPFCHL